MTRWFEDIVINEVFPLGSHTFEADEIIRFATLYDPQYFHLDAEAAKHSHFGGLVASGWHTVSVGHRKMVDRLFAEEDVVRAEGGTPGVSARGMISPARHPQKSADVRNRQRRSAAYA